ncbi:hypothetical protein BABINDRAFT_7397 [Babjeviella inositovora NRRL Y-12698]|uniref:Inositol-pentakisphosphate 2-kinase n=1 Tax=Babjeviella inositovora NRRL Y-12698 TaxID=984486 RepID=A0A1E3QSL3_9ASCO|nr:uncharacterized protein BABINDRAFT_7397 [Babjeviella inositovora NRRL Y-12698]ODQ80693.1 hypothetical protein BABINDRAFT_7397 [Babjeviella inositovora NRRL Y-12698]
MSLLETTPADWEYFTKGNANLLFRYRGPLGKYTDKLLRVRLFNDLPDYVSTKTIVQYVKTNFEESFHKELCEQELVKVSPDFLTGLSERCGHTLMCDDYALVMPNLLRGVVQSVKLAKNCILHIAQEEGSEVVTLEFKPKWLYDNTRIYCRNCAHGQMQGVPRHFCPLDLLHIERVTGAIDDMFLEMKKDETKGILSYKSVLVSFFTNSDILHRLKRIQSRSTQSVKDITSAGDVTEELSLSMTLRDVTLFVEMRQGGTEYSESSDLFLIDGVAFSCKCYVIDLDLKANSKFRHWAKTEQKLQEYYDRTELDAWPGCFRK